MQDLFEIDLDLENGPETRPRNARDSKARPKDACKRRMFIEAGPGGVIFSFLIGVFFWLHLMTLPAGAVQPDSGLNFVTETSYRQPNLSIGITSWAQGIDTDNISSRGDKWTVAGYEIHGFWQWASWGGGALGTGLLVVLLWNYFMRRKANRSAQSPAEKKRYLKQARCEIEAILSSVTSMVLELGLDGVIIRVIPTRYQYKLTGPMEIVGRHVRHFLPRLSEEEIGDILQRVIKNNTPEDMQYPVELDRTRWLNLCLTPLKANSVLVVATDTTEVMETRRNYQDLVELANSIIFRLDREGRVSFMNQYAEMLFGYSGDEVIGRTPQETFMLPRPSGSESKSGVEIPALSEVALDVTHRTRSGEIVYVSYRTRAVFEEGEPAGTVWVGNDVTRQRRARLELIKRKRELQRHSLHDPLTGLPNRALFIERLKHAMERYRRRNKNAYSVLFVDVDRFKRINDSLGHNVGDRMLKSLADVLTNRFRKVDTVARFGSDEFVVLLDEIQDGRSPIKVAERIMEELKKPIEIDGHEIYTSVSIGIAYGGPEYDDPAAILRDADTAMHQAKIEEKGGFRVFHSKMHDRVRELLKMENDLRRALDREEFRVHYQPIIDMRDGRTMALEALIRWQHPEKGTVSPIEFIPMAEDTGLIVPIGEWVLKQACLETRDILASYTNGCGQLSLNLSARQFLDTGLVNTILSTIQATGIDPGRIKLEITETTIMQNGQQASRIIEQLKNCGLSIAIDDFGTGYSSLSYLQQFPFDTLKIDRSFIRKIHEGDNKDIDIITIILSLARALSMDVVAEGIETVLQRDILMGLGCHTGQGFYYAKPMDILQLEQYLTENSMALN